MPNKEQARLIGQIEAMRALNGLASAIRELGLSEQKAKETGEHIKAILELLK